MSLLVILNTAQALPVSQKTDEIEGIAIPVDEAKEFTYELNRDHDLQGSINGGQSGWALEQIDHGVKPEEVISGSRHSIYIYGTIISGRNISTTPIMAKGCRQCLPLSVVQLKGEHCRKPHCRNGVVDHLGLGLEKF